MTIIGRACDLGQHCSWGPHSWERLNPATHEPFRRGRVVFLCAGRWVHRRETS